MELLEENSNQNSLDVSGAPMRALTDTSSNVIVEESGNEHYREDVQLQSADTPPPSDDMQVCMYCYYYCIAILSNWSIGEF